MFGRGVCIVDSADLLVLRANQNVGRLEPGALLVDVFGDITEETSACL
jgi:hypothetical protein